MLIEQSFFSLPEVLHGSGYQTQSYKSGIVSALTLSLLQVLNGRNVPNPIGCLQSERMYRIDGLYQLGGSPRYLRADLFADVNRLYVANRRLSQYGWRHHLWLECKFLRGQAGEEGNTHAGPLHVQHRPIYWCWLTRIDKVEASLGQHTATIDTDRTIIQSENGLTEIAAFIAGRLAILPESPDTQPPRPDEQGEAQAEDEVIAEADE